MKNKKPRRSVRGWLQVRVPVTPEIEEAMSNLLFELGSCGCQLMEHEIVAYFEDEGQQDATRRRVEHYLQELLLLGYPLPESQVQIESVAHQDWNTLWKQQIKPIKISDKLVITPSWERAPAPAHTVVITIDPKQAFGTGHHATTRMALTQVEKMVRPGHSILDVGTGTGILAIAAAKLGAQNVLAFDCDPMAVETAKENLEQNQVDNAVRLFVGELTALRPRVAFDLILANITTKVILNSLNELIDRTKAPGRLFLTGILAEETPKIVTALRSYPSVTLAATVVEEEWLGLALEKRHA